MIITINNEDYDLDTDLLLAEGYLKPKKTEKKPYYLDFIEDGRGDALNVYTLDLNPTTAHKLSEAISALVEIVVSKKLLLDRPLINIVFEARKSHQGDQNE